jgi:hypothetical protein
MLSAMGWTAVAFLVAAIVILVFTRGGSRAVHQRGV